MSESFLRAPQKTQFKLKLRVFANRRGRYPYRPANCSHETTVCSSESLKGAEQPSPQENSVFSGTPKWMQKEFSLAGYGTPKMRAFLGTPRGAVVTYCLPSENGYKNANKNKFKEIL